MHPRHWGLGIYTENSQSLVVLRRALKHAPRPARGAVLGPERLRGAPVRVEARAQRRAPAAEGLGVARADVGPVEPGAEARGRGVGRVGRTRCCRRRHARACGGLGALAFCPRKRAAICRPGVGGGRRSACHRPGMHSARSCFLPAKARADLHAGRFAWVCIYS